MANVTSFLENEAVLLEKVKAGDEYAFELVFKSYYPHLVLLAQKYLHDRDLSENAVQGVFVRLWERRGQLEIKSLKGFLVVAVRNTCTNELKHHQVVREYEKKNDKDSFAWPQFQETVYFDRINKVIAMLPEQRQKIFKMSRLDGLKYREIAEKLNISPKTVEAQMGKALKFLREQLLPLKKQLLTMLLILLIQVL